MNYDMKGRIKLFGIDMVIMLNLFYSFRLKIFTPKNAYLMRSNKGGWSPFYYEGIGIVRLVDDQIAVSVIKW